MKETNLRSIIKVVSWRVLLTISHLLNALLLTGSWETALKIAGLAAVINSVLYWAHERGWNYFTWHRQQKDSTFSERNTRSVSKVVTWRALITTSNFGIPLIVSGSGIVAGAFLGIATLVNVALFFIHERIWNKISFGKVANAI